MAPKKAVKKAITNKKPTKSAKPTKGTKGKSNNDPSAKKKDKKQLKEFIHVPEYEGDEELAVSDEDLDFFNENQGMAGFLSSLDSTALSRNINKKTIKEKEKKETPKKKQQQQQLASSDEDESETFDSDDELDNFEEPEDDDLLLSSDEEEVEEEEDKFDDNSDNEMDYETKPRKVADEWTRKDYHTKLPIKLPGGKIRQVESKPIEDDESEEEQVVEEEVEEVDEEVQDDEEEEEEQEEKPKVSKKQYLINKKEELAEIAGNLQENPEENIDQLRTLRTIYKDDNTTVKKLALLTQLAVYKDIIPGYRIRPLTEAEEGVQVSKEVKKMREYEKSLLSNYEQYLQDLNALLSKKKGNNQDEDTSMATVAARCLCELLTTQTHFNFRLEIMVAVVTRMSTVKWNPIAAMCKQAIITVFENDESGKTSLDAVKMIIRMVKSKGFAISEQVIQTFMHLRLRDEMAHARSKGNNDEQVGQKRKNKEKTFLNKKARKAMRETKEIEKEFKEAEAIVSKEEKDKNQTETLKLIFAFYFRILKKQTSSPLLPSVLEGLSKFAHLISIDFFDDLLNALRDVMHIFEDSNDISRNSSGTRKRLLCIITAFQLLSGQGEAFNYDLKDFYKEIYTILFKATYHTKVEEKPDSQFETESDMLIKGLELMFLRKRQVPIDRLAAFIKRFALVALNLPDKSVLRCLALIQKLVQKDHRIDALLQSEDRATSGIYLPLLEDPELCNPFGTSLYELFLLQNHYDPSVRAMATNLQKTSQ